MVDYLVDVGLIGESGRQVDLARADLRRAVLDRGLSNVDLSGVDARGAVIRGGASDVSFQGARLEDANFSGDELENVKLTDACLSNAKFVGADFYQVDLTRSIGVEINFEQVRVFSWRIADTHLGDLKLRGIQYPDRKTPLIDLVVLW